MVNFAELKAKAEKAKDVSVTKVTNTRDRFTSVPSSKVKWDPNWKRAPPPPPGRAGSGSGSGSTSGPPPPPARSRPNAATSGVGAAPPVVSRTSRPTDSADEPVYTPRPPPTRAASGYPPGPREAPGDTVTKIDWANLSVKDKEAFFGWLDEFFSRYLGIEVGPGARHPERASVAPPVTLRLGMEHMIAGKAPPTVNKSTRPQV